MPILLLIASGLIFEGPVQFQSVAKFEPVPEDSEYFLQSPSSFDVDAQGNYYLVDVEARVVFSWDKAGAFRKVIGAPGEGPGEFQFSGRGPGTGFISALKDGLYVYDGRKREVLVFDTEGVFKKAFALSKSRSRAENFFAMDDGSFLLHRRRFGEEGAIGELLKLDAEGATLKVLFKEEDDSFKMGQRDGRRQFTIKAFNPTLVSSYNHASNEIIVGHSSEPTFKIITGEKSVTVKVPMAQQDVTQEDKDEYMQRFTSGRRMPTVEFPDKKSFYSHILSMGKSGYLVFTQSPYYNNIDGVRINSEGKILGKFKMSCGQGGGLLAARGRALKVSLNSEEEFEISELTIH